MNPRRACGPGVTCAAYGILCMMFTERSMSNMGHVTKLYTPTGSCRCVDAALCVTALLPMMQSLPVAYMHWTGVPCSYWRGGHMRFNTITIHHQPSIINPQRIPSYSGTTTPSFRSCCRCTPIRGTALRSCELRARTPLLRGHPPPGRVSCEPVSMLSTPLVLRAHYPFTHGL